MQERLEGAGIPFLAAETTSWVAKLRAFFDGHPDLSLFVDKPEVERARQVTAGIVDEAELKQTPEGYVRLLDNDQIKRLLASKGWPDLILDPAKQVLRERTLPPAPVPARSDSLPLLVAGLCIVLGPLGSWISRQIIPRAQPWEDKMIPLYDEATAARCRQNMTWGVAGFVAWIALLFVVKCVK